MTITGLENNYYLTQNDIWVVISGFTEVVSKVILDFKNLVTNEELNGFECSASPDNECYFNVCFPIRALIPSPNHIVNNNLQQFQIDITVKFQNTATPDEEQSITKYFVRGGRDKSGTSEWYLNNGDFLVVNYWIEGGVTWTAEGIPVKISGGSLVEDENYPLKTTVQERKNCDGILVKYLNSIGGYQYFYFDRYELKNKTKSKKTIQNISTRLRKDNFKNIGYEETKTMSLYAFTESFIQPNFEDLIRSPQILYYDENGNDNDSKWHLVKIDDNTSTFNNYENLYENKVEFTLPNYRTIEL